MEKNIDFTHFNPRDFQKFLLKLIVYFVCLRNVNVYIFNVVTAVR